MNHVVILKREENIQIQKINKFIKWFFNNFYKSANIFFYEDQLENASVNFKEFYLIGPMILPLLTSLNLDNLFENNKNIYIYENNNNQFIFNIKYDTNPETTIVHRNFNIERLTLTMKRLRKSEIIIPFNPKNIFTSSFIFLEPGQEDIFLSFLEKQYFKWNNLNLVKLKWAPKNKSIIFYDGKNKYESKKIVENMGIGVPITYHIFDKVNDITQDHLNSYEEYILKPTNLDSGNLVFKKTKKNKIDIGSIRKKLNGFEKLKRDKELNPLIQSRFKPKIIMEELISDFYGGYRSPLEVKFYVFNRKIAFFLLINREINNEGYDFYDENFNRFSNERFSYRSTAINQKILKFSYFDDMKKDVIKIYDKFNQDMDNIFAGRFIRIDFFITREKYYFGEFALFPNGGKGRNLNEKGKDQFVKFWLPEVFEIFEETFTKSIYDYVIENLSNYLKTQHFSSIFS